VGDILYGAAEFGRPQEAGFREEAKMLHSKRSGRNLSPVWKESNNNNEGRERKEIMPPEGEPLSSRQGS